MWWHIKIAPSKDFHTNCLVLVSEPAEYSMISGVSSGVIDYTILVATLVYTKCRQRNNLFAVALSPYMISLRNKS